MKGAVEAGKMQPSAAAVRARGVPLEFGERWPDHNYLFDHL